MASSYVVIHELLHVVEEISALEYLERLATTPVSGRDGVVAAGDEFLAFGLGDQEVVVQPPLSMVDGSVGSWLVVVVSTPRILLWAGQMSRTVVSSPPLGPLAATG